MQSNYSDSPPEIQARRSSTSTPRRTRATRRRDPPPTHLPNHLPYPPHPNHDPIITQSPVAQAAYNLAIMQLQGQGFPAPCRGAANLLKARFFFWFLAASHPFSSLSLSRSLALSPPRSLAVLLCASGAVCPSSGTDVPLRVYPRAPASCTHSRSRSGAPTGGPSSAPTRPSAPGTRRRAGKSSGKHPNASPLLVSSPSHTHTRVFSALLADDI